MGELEGHDGCCDGRKKNGILVIITQAKDPRRVGHLAPRTATTIVRTATTRPPTAKSQATKSFYAEALTVRWPSGLRRQTKD